MTVSRRARKPVRRHRPELADLVDVTVEAVGMRGDGIARDRGDILYIPGAAPGDRVRVRRGARRGEGFAADPLALLAEGPDRAKPPCRHFGACGGCAVQRLADARYAAWKRGLVVDALARQGFAPDLVAPLVRTPPKSRRRACLTALRHARGVVLGFAERASHRIVDLAECPVLVPRLVALLPGLRALLAELLGPRETAETVMLASEAGVDLLLIARRTLDLPAREALARFAEAEDLARVSWQEGEDKAPEPVVQRRKVRVLFGGVAAEPPPGAFLQASAAGEAAIVAAVLEDAGKARRVADLYAGCGSLTLPLARSAAVHGVDGDGTLVQAMKAAAGSAGIGGRVTAETRDLARRPLQPDELAHFDAVVFDPPRAGAKAQAEAMAASRVPVIVGVSCNPGTFARDAALLRAGGYVLERVVPIDQFLWSPHVELVARLRREA